MKSDQPTLEEDLDVLIRLGAGRRVLAWLTDRGRVVVPLCDTPEKTAYQLGEIHVAKELDSILRSVNPDAWLTMQREILEGLYEPKSTIPRDPD
jgi:hypothetical protein